jgi:osmotically-inducible protein OsmY
MARFHHDDLSNGPRDFDRDYGQNREMSASENWTESFVRVPPYASDADVGTHRGKGPKNYRRSDERIRELVCERLRDDPDIDASGVEVRVKDGQITLEGNVDSRQTRDAVEDAAAQFGTLDVQNNLRVRKG